MIMIAFCHRPLLAEEDQQLTAAFKRGEPVPQIAQLHERTELAIQARLEKLALIEERWQAR